MFNYNDFLIFELKSNIDQIYLSWYADVDESDFNSVIKLDPTTRSLDDGKPVKMGKYSKWLLDKFKKGELKQEDFYKAEEYLKLFQDNRHLIKKAGLELDINKYKSLLDIYEIVDTYQVPKEIKNENDLLNNKYYLSTDQADLIYKDEKLFIVNTKTEDANKFYGSNSQWCTIKGSFKSYNSGGGLYVIIDIEKLNSGSKDRRVQFHFEKDQFMDMADKNCASFIHKNIETLKKVFNSRSQIQKMDGQVDRYMNDMDLYDFIVNIKENIIILEEEKFHGKIKSYIQNFNEKLDKLGFDKIIELIKGYSNVINKYFKLSDIKDPSKLTKDLFNGNLDEKYIKSLIKTQISNGKSVDLSSSNLKRIGFTMKDDSLFITSVNFLLGGAIDLSEFDLSESDKIYVSYFDKIRNKKIVTKEDAEFLGGKLSEKQILNLLLYIIDHGANLYEKGVNSVKDFLRYFSSILVEMKSMNNKARDNKYGHFKGVFEMVSIMEKIDSILSNKIRSFRQYSILT